jgi:hypothetical protein
MDGGDTMHPFSSRKCSNVQLEMQSRTVSLCSSVSSGNKKKALD